MSRILTVSGSPSRSSRTAAVLAEVGRRLVLAGHDVDVLHLRALSAGLLLMGDGNDRFVADVARRLERADAVVLGTPIYQAS